MTTDTLATRRLYDRDRLLGVSHAPIPADHARKHLTAMTTAGASAAAIAKAAGITRPAVVNILSGQPTIRRSTAARVMRVRLADVIAQADPTHLVPVVGAQRRIRALLALGHTHETISTLAGVQSWRLLIPTAPARITAEKWRAIAAAYDRLSMTPGASAITRRRAARAGYAPPLAWDDDQLDNPAARPAGTGWKRSALDLDEWVRLIRTGENASVAARRCGVSVSGVEAAARRLGRADVLDLVSGARSAERLAS